MAAVVEDVLQNRLELLGLSQWSSGFSTAAGAVGLLDGALSASQRKQLSYGVGFGAVSAGIVAGLGRAVKAAGSLEQTQVGFKTMLGSAEAARAKIEELQDFAAGSPFDFGESAKGAQQLLAMGVSAGDLIPVMKAVGNATAAAGGDTDTFLRGLRAIGQIRTKGVLQGDELLQLSEAGIPAVKILQEELGLTSEQMRNLGREGITADKAIAALTKGFSRQFAGAMEAQSKTLVGSFSNLTDSVNRAAAAIGQPIAPFVTAAAQGVTEAVNVFNDLPEPVKNATAAVAVLAAVGLGALAIKSAIAVVQLGKLAAENVELANQELKSKAATLAHTASVNEEAAAHDAAAAAAIRHATAEAQLSGGHGGGGTTGGTRGTQRGPRRRGGSTPAVQYPRQAGETPIRPGQKPPTGMPLPSVTPAVNAGKNAAKLGTAAKIGGALRKVAGGPAGVVAEVGTQLALGALPDEGSAGVVKRLGQSTAAGAGIGATVGSLFPGVGTAAGAVVGGALGAGKAGLEEWQRTREAGKQEQAAKLAAAGGGEGSAVLAEMQKQTAILEKVNAALGKTSPIPYEQVSRYDQGRELLRALG